MAGYSESIKTGHEFAARQFGEAAKAIINLSKLEEQKLKTDATISETLQQLRAKKQALDKAIEELELIQNDGK